MSSIWLWLIWWAMFLLWLKQYWVFIQFLRFASITLFFLKQVIQQAPCPSNSDLFFRPNIYDKPNNKSNCMTAKQWSVVFCNFNASNDNFQLKENVTSKQLGCATCIFLTCSTRNLLVWRLNIINKNVLKTPPLPKILDLSFYVDHLPSFWHFLLLADWKRYDCGMLRPFLK